MRIEDDGIWEGFEKYLDEGASVSVCPYSVCFEEGDEHVYMAAVSLGWGDKTHGVSLYSLNLVEDERTIIKNSLPEKCDQYDETVYNLVGKKAVQKAEEICKFLEQRNYSPEMMEFRVQMRE